ncbi:MAG: DUF1330 domain-containing protein [Acidobacteriota bacterium]|nr:DUF1330 domain-containing protein [Acidobacteriota bacterium]
MAAYVVVNVDVNDPVRYEAYKTMVPPTVAAYGGKFLVRGAPLHEMEGQWPRKRLVIVEFPDVASAKAWWASEEYAGAKALRQANSSADLVIVEGVAG